MVRRVLVALLWVIAVLSGVAIAALSHSLSLPVHGAGGMSSVLLLWLTLPVAAVLLMIVLWRRARQPAQ